MESKRVKFLKARLASWETELEKARNKSRGALTSEETAAGIVAALKAAIANQEPQDGR